MKTIIICLALVSLMSCNSPVSVYEWRGANRAGVYNESALLRDWPAEGPDLLWSVDGLGHGYGSPVVAGDRIYLTGTNDSTAVLRVFEADGTPAGEVSFGDEWNVNFPGSRCTPTVYGNEVYVLSGKGDLACISAESLEVLWTKSLLRDFNGIAPRFGFAQSPVVDDEKVYCTAGDSIYNVVALDRKSGALSWSCKGMGERLAYNSGRIIDHKGRKIVLLFSAYHLMAIDAEKGELLWTHEQRNTPVEKREPGAGDTHGNTVLYENDTLYYVEGDGNGAVALRLADDGNAVEEIWHRQEVDNYMGGIVNYDGFLYTCGFSKRNLLKMNARSGLVLDSLDLGRGALIAADQLLFYYNFRGEVHLVDVRDQAFESRASFKIKKGTKEHFAHPVLHNGTLLIRHGDYLGAYKVQ
ncbi:outer membrane protein assembly factor BamB family protein [Roseimarinus sediminis]|uniref:outer membrane protein assembly factor BamB family protein n=1 Tax=Roseimarinus sediminis TaxID=1610899 RepID=UPI003D225EC4